MAKVQKSTDSSSLAEVVERPAGGGIVRPCIVSRGP